MRKSIVNVSIYDVYNEPDENGTYRNVDRCNGSNMNNGSTNITGYDCINYTSAEFMLGELGALIGNFQCKF